MSVTDAILAIEDAVLYFEADVLSDRLWWVRVRDAQAFVDELLDLVWKAQTAELAEAAQAARS